MDHTESTRNKDYDASKALKTIFSELRKNANELKDRFSKSKIKEIRRYHYKAENEKESFYTKNKRDKRNLLELEKNLFKYYDYDDIEYEVTRDIRN